MALIVKIGANLSNFDRQMKKLTKDVKTVGTKLKNVGAGMTAAITLPVAAIGAAAIKTGMDFEAAMSKVAAISGATGDDFAALEAKAREMGATTQFSASEAAEALTYMAMAGWKTEDMLSGIEGVMALAAASGEDLATVSDIVTDALTAFGMSAAESGRFADVLAAASANANTNVSMLGESFKYVAPVAGALGYSVEDTSKALSLMANAGIKGTQAGTALRTMLTNLSSPTAKTKKAMDELGISLTNSDGTMKSLDEVMQDLRTSFAGLDESQQAAYASTIFGREAMSGALAIINASEEDYNKLTEAINSSDGAAQSMADTMTDNLAGRLKEMQSALEEAALTIYDNLKPALETIVEAVKGLADWFNNLSPSTQNLIIGLAGLAAAIGPLLTAVGIGIILFGQLSATLSILGISMATAFWWVLAIIAALAGIVAVVVYWEEIKTFFINLWESLKEIFFNALEAIKGFFVEWGPTILMIITGPIGLIVSLIVNNWDTIKTVTSAVWNFIIQYLKAIWDAIKVLAAPVFNAIKSVISNIWNTIKSVTSTVWNAIKGAVTRIWNSIKSTASTVWNALKSTIMTPVNYIKDRVSSAFESLKSTAIGVWEGIKSGIRTAINGIIRIVNNFINGFNTPAKLLNKLPGVNAPIIPNIPLLATGGKLLGSGMAIVGEAGPELIEKSGSSVRVTPLTTQERAQGVSGAARPIEVHNHFGNVIADKQGLKKLERMLASVRIDEQGRKGVATT